MVLCLRLFCCVRTEVFSFVSFKNTVLCTAKLFAMMDIWMYGQKLVSALTAEWALFVFLCSFVLVSLLFYISCSRWHCAVVEIRSLVLARDDGIVGTCGV